MDEKTFKMRVSRLEQIADALTKLPVEVRLRAFALLEGYVIGDEKSHSPEKRKESEEEDAQGDKYQDRDQFFAQFDHKKPADNVKLIAAYLYKEYGSEPFSIEEIGQLATDVGITIPARVDATLKAGAVKSKKLFNQSGKGRFKPTVNGEAYFKATYNVKKGNKKRPAETE